MAPANRARREHAHVLLVPVMLAVATIGVSPVSGQTLDEVLSRSGDYVKNYGGQVSSIVAREQYRQEWTQPPEPRTIRVTLSAEFALVRAGGAAEEWAGFRDVVEVNGKPVQDRNDRLQQLFAQGAANVLEEARRIADEGARFNLGPVNRNFNVPTTAMFFLHPANQGRFRWQKSGEASAADGTRLWELSFKEQSKPTVIRTSKGKNMPAKGRVWLNPVDGSVVQTEISLSDFARDVDESNATINVLYALDPSLKMWLPSRMNEEYRLLRHNQPAIGGQTGKNAQRSGLPLEVELGTGAIMTRITGVAEYGGYRQFETGARVVPK